MSARVAQIDERAKTLPGKPEDYKLELPAEFKAPDGVTWAWDDKDPRLPAIRQLAKDAGLDQSQFSQLLAAHAGHELTQQKSFNDAKAAENKKLGANAAARVDAVKAGLSAIIPKDKAESLMRSLMMASDVVAMEDLLRAVSNQSGSNYSNNGREPPPPPQPSQDVRWYPNMQQKAS